MCDLSVMCCVWFCCLDTMDVGDTILMINKGKENMPQSGALGTTVSPIDRNGAVISWTRAEMPQNGAEMSWNGMEISWNGARSSFRLFLFS